MNILKLDIGHSYTDPTLLLYIDGTEFQRIILDNDSAAFFPNLVDSAKESGDYLILTCVCGVADCGGWEKISVVHKNNIILWTFLYDDKKYVFQFDKKNYENEIHKIQTRLNKEKLTLHPPFL